MSALKLPGLPGLSGESFPQPEELRAFYERIMEKIDPLVGNTEAAYGFEHADSESEMPLAKAITIDHAPSYKPPADPITIGETSIGAASVGEEREAQHLENVRQIIEREAA